MAVRGRRDRLVPCRPRAGAADHDYQPGGIRRPEGRADVHRRARPDGQLTGARRRHRAERPAHIARPLSGVGSPPGQQRQQIAVPLGKASQPELVNGPARLVISASRPVFFGLRTASTTITRDVQVRLDPPRVSVALDPPFHQPWRRGVHRPPCHAAGRSGRYPRWRRRVSGVSGHGGRARRSGRPRRVLRAAPRSGPSPPRSLPSRVITPATRRLRRWTIARSRRSSCDRGFPSTRGSSTGWCQPSPRRRRTSRWTRALPRACCRASLPSTAGSARRTREAIRGAGHEDAAADAVA